MKIEIIAIGNEILSGSCINTNASFISNELTKLGYNISLHSVFSDEENELEENLKKSIDQSDLLIITGGIGPTADDRTKKVVSKLVNDEMQHKEKVFEELNNRFGEKQEHIELSNFPSNATLFPNTIGTAYGFAVDIGKKTVILLPGVPSEMREMFISFILPFIQKKFPIQKNNISKKFYLCLLRESDVEIWIKKYCPSTIKYGIYPSFGMLQLHFSVEKDKKNLLDEFSSKFSEKFFSYIYSIDEPLSISQALHNELCEKNKTIVFAESCTGGGVSFRTSQIPGASKIFLGSIVSYSNEVKKHLLHVKEKTLEKYGAVSLQTVEEMIFGIFSQIKADFAIAISGIAGPSGATSRKPVGTVCIACCENNKFMDVGTLHLHGNRETIMETTIQMAYGILWRNITHNKKYFS